MANFQPPGLRPPLQSPAIPGLPPPGTASRYSPAVRYHWPTPAAAAPVGRSPEPVSSPVTLKYRQTIAWRRAAAYSANIRTATAFLAFAGPKSRAIVSRWNSRHRQLRTGPLVIDAFDIAARRHRLEAVGVGGDQGIGDIVRHRAMAVEAAIADHGIAQEIVGLRLGRAFRGVHHLLRAA